MSHSHGIVCQCLYFIPESQRINTVRFCLCTLGNRMRLLGFCTIPVGNTGITGSCRAGSCMDQSRRRRRIRISRKHTARNHHGAQKRAKRTDPRHRGFIISADPLRDFRNDYVAILHPAPYDLVYLIHNFNPILSLFQKIFSPVYKSFDRFYHLPLLSLRYFRLGKPSAHDASLKPPQQASLYHPLCFVYSGIHNPAVNTKIILPYALSFFNHKFCKYKISSIHAVFLLFIN